MREKKRFNTEKLLKTGSIFLFVAVSVLLFPYKRERAFLMRAGEIPSETIIAPFTFEVPKTKEEIEREKREIMEGMTFVLVPLVLPSFDERYIKEQIKDLPYKTRKKFIEEIKKLISELRKEVILENIDTLIESRVKVVILMDKDGERIYPVDKIYTLEDVKNVINRKAEEVFGEDKTLAFLFEELSKPFIVPTWKIDFEETKRRIEKKMKGIKKYKTIIYKGEVIAQAGKPLTPFEIEKLHAMERIKGKGIKGILEEFILRLLLVIFVMFAAYMGLKFLFIKVYKDSKIFLILLFNSLLFLIVTGILIRLLNNPFIIPFTFIPFFFFFIIGRNFSIFITIIMAIFTSLYAGYSVFLLIFYLTTGLVSILIAKYLRVRLDLIFGFIVLSIFSFFTFYVIKNFIFIDIKVTDIFLNSFISSGSAILWTILFLPIHEKIFGITTDFVLLELANHEYPLLKELEKRAPGTFEHSVNISELARIAADAIGANPLLAKVGALYHDIGKMENPHYFIENIKEENPHDKLSPMVSVLVLQNHVKKGIEIAKRERLPEGVIRIIERHHGTLLMTFFYEKAKKIDPSVSEEDFRYKCPKPETKEEAIIMLLDGIEAKVRSLEKYDYSSLEEAIDSVINHRFSDGQFDECEITRRDMEKIKEAILPKFITRFHRRIVYPPLKAKEKIVGNKKV